MSLLPTHDDVARIQRALASRRFLDARVLSVEFESDPEALRRVLPPPLALAEPVVAATIGTRGGGACGPYASATLFVPVLHDHGPGRYVLATYLSTDAAVIFGKELEGAPKKVATVTLDRAGPGRFHGSVERHGTTLLRVEAELDEDLGRTEAETRAYCVVARFRPDGSGLLEDAVLTASEGRSTWRVRRRGTGTVQLASTPHDPLGDIPVGAVRAAIYVEGDSEGTCVSVQRIAAAAFEPYAYARLDDWIVLDRTPARA